MPASKRDSMISIRVRTAPSSPAPQTMLCNGAGIDAISVTSLTHEWNRVLIDDNWYNLDVTWDDTMGEADGILLYDYFLKSDEYWDAYDAGTGYYEDHVEESDWDGFLMDCVLDSTYSGTHTGTLPTVSEYSYAPIISYSPNGSKYSVSILADAGEWVFYTTDGSDPSVSSTRCSLYTEPFKVSEYGCVKVAAYTPGYLMTTESYDSTGLSVPSISSAKNVKTKKIKVKFSPVSDVSGYELQYATNKSFTKSVGSKLLAASKSSCTLKKLKKGKTYYIRLRSYLADEGDDVCSPWSAIKKVKVKK